VRPNNLIILFLAIAMGGIAAFLAHNWIEGHSRAFAAGDSAGTVVVAAEPLGFGAEVSADSVTEIPWIAESLPTGAFVVKEDLLKDGRRVVLSRLERGEPILRSKITGPGQRALLSSLLNEGKRAVTLRVDDVRGVAGFILPGDFVDVVLIAEDGPPRRENYSEILLQHLKVLAVDQLASERQEKATVAKAVTIEVTPEQAQKLLLATNIGKLSLILRPPEEANAESGRRRVTERDIGRIDARITADTARPPPPPPPPPAVAAPAPPTNTAKVAIVRNNKREEYTVRRVDNWIGNAATE
jgi:pilus assembly protein CpaB